MTDQSSAATEPGDARVNGSNPAVISNDRPGASGRRTIRLGVIGGAVATVVMTLFRMPITDSLPPTAQFWAKYVGDGEPGDYPLQALVLHLGYGVGAGVAFATAFVPRSGDTDATAERRGTLLATLFALLLSGFGTRVMLVRVLDLGLSPDERWIFHVSHVVYGLTLGAWLGSNVPER